MINPAYLLVIKDDDDIVYRNMEYYYKIGLRTFFVMFHCPSENTVKEVIRFANKHKVTLYHFTDNDYTYKKDIHFNRLSKEAYKKGFNWHVATDTDELLVLRKHKTIYGLIDDYNKSESLIFKWFNYKNDGNPCFEWQQRQLHPQKWGKAIVRWNSVFSWAAGQHHVINAKKTHVPPDVAFYAHFPHRDKDRWIKRRVDFAKTKFDRFGDTPSWPEWNRYCKYEESMADPEFWNKRWGKICSKKIPLIADPVLCGCVLI